MQNRYMNRSRFAVILFILFLSFSILLASGMESGRDAHASERIFAEDHASTIGIRSVSAGRAEHTDVCLQRTDLQKHTPVQKQRITSLKKSRLHAAPEGRCEPVLIHDGSMSGFLPLLRDAHNGFYLAVSGLSPPVRSVCRA